MSKLYSSRRIVSALENKGFTEAGQKGSHRKFRKGNKVVIVPHPKKEIPMGTFYSIVRQSGLKREDFDE